MLVGQRKWPRRSGGWRRQQRLDGRDERCRFHPLWASPRQDHDSARGLRDSPGFAESGDRVGGKLKRVEARDGVEGAVWKGELFQVSESEVCGSHSLARDAEKALGCIDA
jgi:hypothetical protein